MQSHVSHLTPCVSSTLKRIFSLSNRLAPPDKLKYKQVVRIILQFQRKAALWAMTVMKIYRLHIGKKYIDKIISRIRRLLEG